MSDLFVWGGPVNCSTMKMIEWLRPTQVFCKPIAGSGPNYRYYQSLPDGIETIAKKAKVPDFESFGMAGFSAFHGFARAALKDERHRERIRYVHLADACFMGAGAKEPFSAFVWFAERAARGLVRMTITTNGPMGHSISYSHAGKDYNLTSGAQCIELIYDRVLSTVGGTEKDAEAPTDVPAPTFAKKLGELYWFHYEKAPRGKGPHAWHANDLAAPYVQHFGVPWMAGEGVRATDFEVEPVWASPVPQSETPWLLYGTLGAIGAGAAWLLWRTR